MKQLSIFFLPDLFDLLFTAEMPPVWPAAGFSWETRALAWHRRGGHTKYLFAHQNASLQIITMWAIGTCVQGWRLPNLQCLALEKEGRDPRIFSLFLFSIKDQCQSAKKQNL